MFSDIIVTGGWTLGGVLVVLLIVYLIRHI
jgi:hypothetical protein